MPGGDITHIDLDHFARVVPDTLSSVGVTACCDQQGEHGTVWSRSEQGELHLANLPRAPNGGKRAQLPPA